jgi:hypothetical protein
MSAIKNLDNRNDIKAESLLMSICIDLGRIIYTHKTHEKEIELLSKVALILRWMELTLISFTAGGSISILLGTGFYFQFATATLATLATMVTIYKISFNPELAIQEHRICARKIWLMREKYINLLCDLFDQSTTYNKGRVERDKLLIELYEIYREAPNTSQKAFIIARNALKIKDEGKMSEKELDEILPPSLQKIFDSKRNN